MAGCACLCDPEAAAFCAQMVCGLDATELATKGLYSRWWSPAVHCCLPCGGVTPTRMCRVGTSTHLGSKPSTCSAVHRNTAAASVSTAAASTSCDCRCDATSAASAAQAAAMRAEERSVQVQLVLLCRNEPTAHQANDCKRGQLYGHSRDSDWQARAM